MNKNNKRLFVAGLPWSFDDARLTDLFAPYGNVVYAKVIRDRETNKSKGFGFVEFEVIEDAKKAIEDLNNSVVENRTIVVNVAKEQPKRDNRR